MQLISRSVQDTLNIGKRISGHLKPADIICLFGELGSGKTVLAKGIAGGLGIKKEKIISPTFVLIRQYPRAKIPLYHFDLYRVKTAKDILGLGYEEYFYGAGITVIEWADRLMRLMPAGHLKIKLSVKKKNQRLLEFVASGARYKKILENLREDLKP